MRWRRRLRWALLVFLILLVLSLVTHPGRVTLKSAGLFVEIFPSAPVRPQRWFTADPSVTTVTYSSGDAQAAAYIYRPAGEGQHGALVFYIGVGPEHENRHLVRVSKALARAGVVVMVPVSPALSDFKVVAGEEEGAVAAFEYLRAQPYVDPDRVGFLGVSVGGSIAMMAAQDPRIADDVRLVESFGGYYSAFDLLSALVLRQIEVDGEWREWQPSDVPLEIFRDTLLALLPESDRQPLLPLFEGSTTTIPDGLTAEGRAAAELLVNRDPARMPRLIAALPLDWRTYLAEVSPATNIEDLRAEILLMHDRRDNIIPFTESIRFYQEAEGVRDKHLTLLNLFRHVEPQSGGDWTALPVEGMKLYAHIYRLLTRLT